MDLFDCPLGQTIEKAWDAGRSLWVLGWTEDGSRALLVDSERDTVTVAHRDSTGSLGRWECSYQHLQAHGDLYRSRFPRQA